NRVIQIGRAADIVDCRAALLRQFGPSIDKASSHLIEPVKAFREPIDVEAEGLRIVLPQLRRVATLLLGVGEDLPALRLASLMTISRETERDDLWFLRRDIDETSKVSFARRLYNDAGSEGNLTALARNFLLD